MHEVRFYRTVSGNQIVLNWLRSLSAEDRKAIGEDLRVVQIGFPVGLPLCRSLGRRLWEVRSSLPRGREARLLFFHSAMHQALVAVHGFIKKTQKTRDEDIDLARKRMREYQD